MGKVEIVYKIVHLHHIEEQGIISICIEPLTPINPSFSMSPLHQTEADKVMQNVVKQVMLNFPLPKQKNYVSIDVTPEDYEKLGKPNIMDEITLTLETKETS